jgi:hypothetical protein
MSGFREETAAFKARKMAETANAMQLAALQLACGIDLTLALDATLEQRHLVTMRLGRAIERERLKGIRGHWSYDLNRHIALKQALDRICQADRPREDQDHFLPTPRPKRGGMRNGVPKDAV